jgi:RNA polymerase sigma factor (sigma-70 family)
MSVSQRAVAASPSAWVPRRLLSDARLAELAGLGDDRAFEAIFERYHQELYRYCRGILGDPDEAQDALQSTMTNALRALPRDGRQIALRPWLYRVAHNEAISIVRRRAATVSLDHLPETQVPGADSEAEGRERLQHLVADLDNLAERQRGALVMRELSGLSYAEIGDALSASEAAARQTVYEARLALRELKRGREMECETARHAMSERDARVLRGRRLRAHLRTCESCGDFWAGISQRRSDLRVLCPPMPALAASGVLAAVLGEAGAGGAGAVTGAVVAGGGTAGIAGGTGIAGSAAVKGASIAAAVVIGAGAAGTSGVVKLPLVNGRGAAPDTQATPVGSEETAAGSGAKPAGKAGGAGQAGRNAPAGDRGGGSVRADGHRRAPEGRRVTTGRRGDNGASSVSAAPGNAGAKPGAGSMPVTSNGSPPGHSTAGGGSHGNPHRGASAGPSGKVPPGHANGRSNAPTLPEHAQGKTGSPPGRSGSPPDHSGSPPDRSSSAGPGARPERHGG